MTLVNITMYMSACRSLLFLRYFTERTGSSSKLDYQMKNILLSFFVIRFRYKILNVNFDLPPPLKKLITRHKL